MAATYSTQARNLAQMIVGNCLIAILVSKVLYFSELIAVYRTFSERLLPKQKDAGSLFKFAASQEASSLKELIPR
jgi:hypothetical protein